VAEHLHDRIGAKTLFATHYHELTALADTRPRVRNLSTAVREEKGEIVFLHRLVEGGASRSYGIHVASLAGILPSVIARAKQILAALESGDPLAPHALPRGQQLSLVTADEKRTLTSVEKRLAALDLDELSPRQAHAMLLALQAELKS
jgi:DNA mismatch repair protein MutS